MVYCERPILCSGDTRLEFRELLLAVLRLSSVFPVCFCRMPGMLPSVTPQLPHSTNVSVYQLFGHFLTSVVKTALLNNRIIHARTHTVLRGLLYSYIVMFLLVVKQSWTLPLMFVPSFRFTSLFLQSFIFLLVALSFLTPFFYLSPLLYSFSFGLLLFPFSSLLRAFISSLLYRSICFLFHFMFCYGAALAVPSIYVH